MNTRRWIALAILVALAVTIAPLSSRAQSTIPMISHGIINATVASVNAANTTAEILLYEFTVPASFLASWTTSNRAFGSAPMHLRLNGGIKTLGTVGGITGNSLAVSIGGSTASMMVVNGNALPPDLGAGTACAGAAQGAAACQAPVALDVMFSPIATVMSQNCTDLRVCNPSVYMSGRFVVASTNQGQANYQFTTETTYNTASLSALNLNSASSYTIKVLWRWGSAASGNSLNIYNGVLKLGF